MNLIIIYTITVFVALLLFYPVLNLFRYLRRRFAQNCPRLHHVIHYLLSYLLPATISNLSSLFLVIIPGTNSFARNVQYPLFLPRRYWMSITRLEFVILALCLGANVAVLVLERVNIGSVAAMLAIINAAPLFLGNHTNPFADFVGIPLSTYTIFHHFIGRVVVIEGSIHAILALRRS